MPTPFPQGPTYKKTAKKYTVRTGDTWNSIANQNGVPVNQITGANQGMSLTPGVVVRVPTGGWGATLNQQQFGIQTPFGNFGLPSATSTTPGRGFYRAGSGDLINPAVSLVGRGINAIAGRVNNMIQNWGEPYRAGMGDVQRAGNYPSVYPAAATQTTAQQTGYQPTGWNAIVNQPSPTGAGGGYNLPSGLSQKELNEYSSYVEWAARDPNRTINNYEEYLTAKYSGGGGDFWEYMQGVKQASGGGGYASAKRRNTQQMLSYKDAKSENPSLTYRKWLMRKMGKWKQANTQYSDEEEKTEENIGNAAVQVSGGSSGYGYNYYNKPESFGLVTWRT